MGARKVCVSRRESQVQGKAQDVHVHRHRHTEAAFQTCFMVFRLSRGEGGGAGGAQVDPIQPDVHVRTCRSAVITCVEELRSSTVLANGRLTCICMPRKEAFDWTHFEQVSSVGEPKGARKV